MTPFLSICILAYNRVRTLAEALDSLLPQVECRDDVELMVSDDASPDPKLEEMMRGYCERHPRLRYVRIPVNCGLDGNVVATLENADGEYTALFSDDDLVPADYVARLVAILKEHRPTVSYVNHTPFFDNDPSKTGAPTQPVVTRLFTKGSEYFLYTGLGFMSAVTVKTSEARKFIPNVARGLSSAHVDIASRVALSTAGPYLFDGTLTVLARYELASSYDVLTHGPMNVTKVHMKLRDEGLLTQADVDWFNVKAIRLFLPRCIVNNRLNSKKPVPASELHKLYGSYPEFYRFSYPLALIPPALLKCIALPARAIMRLRRKSRLKRGITGAKPAHLAPS